MRGDLEAHKYSLRRKHVLVYLLLQEIVLERQKIPTILNNSRHMLKRELQPVLMDTWKWNRNSCCAFIRQQLLVPLIIFEVYQSLLTALSCTQLEEHQVLLYRPKQKHLITSVGAGSVKLLKKAVLGTEVALWKAQTFTHHSSQQHTAQISSRQGDGWVCPSQFWAGVLNPHWSATKSLTDSSKSTGT